VIQHHQTQVSHSSLLSRPVTSSCPACPALGDRTFAWNCHITSRPNTQPAGMMIKAVNPAEVLTSSVNSLSEQMRWRASLSSSRSSRLQESWNHNLHYHRLIIDVIAPDCQRGLDVGCGQGALIRRLRPLVPDVTGMDRDDRSIASARTRGQARFPDLRYVQADFLAESVKPGGLTGLPGWLCPSSRLPVRGWPLAERCASQGQDLGTVIGEQEALRDRRIQRGGEPGQVVSRTSGIAAAQFVRADRHGGAE
jgi:SAM-dependent methyltransferase